MDFNAPLDCEIKPETVEEDYELMAASTTTTYDTYMEAYFRGLKTNMGENYKGSCGYVALGELLSYYDSYLNDYFIDDIYDVASTGSETDMISRNNSPGILNDTISTAECAVYEKSSVSSLTASEYFSIIETKVSTSLHAKLISMGEEHGYYDYSDNDNPCGTNYAQRKIILEEYLEERGLSSDYYEIITYSNSNSDNVEDFIKQYIDLGYPVLTSVYDSSRNAGHAVICYDYDDTNIYCNMGWSGSTSYAHYAVESRYDTYRNAMVVIFDLDHYHSNNYEVIQSGGTTTYCYCNCDILTYKEVGHSYTDHYVDNGDNFYHRSYCRCNRYILEKHSWADDIILVSLPNSYKLNCDQCGAMKNNNGGSYA